MGQAQTIEGYGDVIDLLNRALEADKGIRVAGEIKFLKNLRQRCYAARRQDVRRSMRLFPEGDPRHGKSHYDRLILQIQPDGLHILQSDKITFTVEEL